MRAIFGVLGLLIVLAVVGVLVKKQLSSTQQAVPALQLPAAGGPAAAASASVKQQAQQMEQQYKQAVESAIQQPRPMPDEK